MICPEAGSRLSRGGGESRSDGLRVEAGAEDGCRAARDGRREEPLADLEERRAAVARAQPGHGEQADARSARFVLERGNDGEKAAFDRVRILPEAKDGKGRRREPPQRRARGSSSMSRSITCCTASRISGDEAGIIGPPVVGGNDASAMTSVLPGPRCSTSARRRYCQLLSGRMPGSGVGRHRCP